MDLWGREDEEERTRRLFGIHAGAAEEKHFASHEELAAAIHTCAACHLRQEGNLGPVLSSGPVPAPLMLVGEGPGGVEDDWGAPLIGPSGQLLDKALASVGITRDRVYVTNVVKCRPRGNRTPDIAEGRACADRWLREEIRLVQLKAVVALGKAALRILLSGMNSVPEELIEAARLEKAPNSNIFTKIVVPLTSSSAVYILIMTIVQGLQYVFTPIKVLTQGGPNDASSNIIYQGYDYAFTFYETGMSAALAIITMLIFLVLLYLEFRYVEKGVYYEN